MKEKILALEKIVNNQKDDDLKQPIKSVNANTNLTQDKLININSLSSKKDMKKKKKKSKNRHLKLALKNSIAFLSVSNSTSSHICMINKKALFLIP